MADYRDDLYTEVDQHFAMLDGAKDHFAVDNILEDPTAYEMAGVALTPAGWVENASPDIDGAATVTIDTDGITIANGALTLIDEFGETVLTAGGIVGSWLGMIMSSLYNNNFVSGVDGAMTFDGAASASEVPYWRFSGRSHSTVTATRIAAASAPGGSVIEIKQTVGDPGVPTYGQINQSGVNQGLIRVQGGRGIVCRAAWRAVGAALAQPVRMRFVISWVDKDLNVISTVNADCDDRTATDTADTYPWDYTFPVIAPVDAVYAGVAARIFWSVDAGTNDAGEIAEVDIGVADYENNRLAFREYTIEWEDGGSFPNQLVIDDGSSGAVVRVEGNLKATSELSADTLVVNSAGGVAGLTMADNYIVFDSIGAEPGNAAAGHVRLYARTNGGGKVEIRARFPSGAFQTLATEP